MIGVLNIPAVTWTLTVILLLSGSYYILQAAKSHMRTDQINKSLHALMNVLMAVMLWNLVPSTVLAQIAVLTGAALWFVIQAVARPEFKILCAGSQGRLKCGYHSLSMGGAAFMIVMMSHAAAIPGNSVNASGISMSHGHHAIAAENHNTVATSIDQQPTLAILLTALFGAAAVIFLILFLRSRITPHTPNQAAAPRFSLRAEHGFEALGATIMALMFATMSA